MAITWGVIGAGGIADRRTIPEGFMPSPMCHVGAVMDPDADRARAAARKYGVDHWYTAAEELLEQGDIQAVYIASPVHAHKDQVIAAANRGKHILCEKPLGLTVAECEHMLAACKRHGVKLQVGYMMRFHHLHRKLKEMIAAGELGDPVLCRANFTIWYPQIEGAWRQDAAMAGGGAIMDLGSHCVDLLRFLLGEVVEVAAYVDTLVFEYDVDDIATLLLRFDNGAHGIVDVAFCVPEVPSQNRLEVYGTKGSVIGTKTIGQGGGELFAYLVDEEGAAQERRPVEADPVNMYQAEVEHFANCILNDQDPEINGQEATKTQRVLEAARRAWETGQVQRL